MTRWFLLCLVAGACGGQGTRAECAEGGALNDCPDSATTAEGACTRLVDCGAIPLSSDNNFDWGDCIDRIEGADDAAQTLVVDCISASTCDALKIDGSPDQPNNNPPPIHCFLLGGIR